MTRMHSSRMRTVRNSSRLLPGDLQPPPPRADPPSARHAGIPPPTARHAGIPPAMHAGIPTPPPPREQNDRHV